ncbi:hypothetical protein C8R48DRAFT_722321 [Suillus tomentosus]|nr:hypothetical protein C8R48DRAFT_722321 [Suillus tomentosus]
MRRFMSLRCARKPCFPLERMQADSYYSADDVAAAKSLQLLAYTSASMTTLWIYDYACSFHDELTFLLQSRWTKVKGLYVIARYLPFLVLVTYQYRVGLTPNDPNKCRMVNNIIYFCLSVISVACSEFLFLLRTYALWNNNGIVLAAMLSAFFVVAVASIIVDVVTVEVSHVAMNAVQGIRSCYETSSGVQAGTMFVLLFGFQLGIAFLTIIRAVQRWRAVNCPLYDVLVKHNIFYYTCGLRKLGRMFPCSPNDGSCSDSPLNHQRSNADVVAENCIPPCLQSVCTCLRIPNHNTNHAYSFEFYFLAILATRMHLFLWQTDQQTRGSGTLVHIPMSDVLPAYSTVTTV